MSVELQRGDGELGLSPEIGGAVSHFRWGGRNLLRPAPAQQTSSVLSLSGFPMVPFSGRIANGRFEFDGRMITQAPNFPPEPHTIHGHGWQAAWTLEEQNAADAVLAYRHTAGVWPWTYTARQHFTLLENGLGLRLTLVNESDTDMPAGIGWHPYFPRGDAQIRTQVDTIWRTDGTGIPNRPCAMDAASDVRAWRSVDDLDLDNAFGGARGETEIRWVEDDVTLRLVADPVFEHLVIFTPPGRDFFCVEPTSHAPDAVNSTLAESITGLRRLGPGETLSGEIRLLLD